MTIALTPPPSRSAFEGLEEPTLVARYRHGPNHFSNTLLNIPDDLLDTYWRPEAEVGRWSIRALLGHLADCEIVFAHRLRRIVAEDNPTVGAFDENAFIDSGLYNGAAHPIAGFLAAIVTTRNWCGQWLSTLEEDAFSRTALHTETGPITFKGTLSYTTWHLEHHAYYLRLKLEKIDTPSE
ncbi:MAG: DinB family protein [Planctomycetota bacterium]